MLIVFRLVQALTGPESGVYDAKCPRWAFQGLLGLASGKNDEEIGIKERL